MTKRIATTTRRIALILGINLLSLAAICTNSRAYETYSGGSDGGCIDCHGDFADSTSPKGTIFPSSSKHEMHRANTSMNTDCSLCHTSPNRTPVYLGSSDGTANNPGLGCSGCHVGPGLREHHKNNGVALCYDCHTYAIPDPENVKPPYYGTPDTKANNPGNTAKVANTNENWSIGDFIGLDNDGNNLYDTADFSIGPYRVLTAAKEGNDLRISWVTAGGRRDTLQVATNISGTFSNLSPALAIPGVGQVTTNYLQVNGATGGSKFYRLHYTP
jgi:hypothetical protein